MAKDSYSSGSELGGSAYNRYSGLSDDEKDKNPNYANYTAQELQTRQQDAMNDQEQQLGQLERGVKGLRHQANAINNEVVDQNVMIDDIGQNMQDTTQDIQAQEQKAREINKKKKKVCFLYVIIVLLIIALVLILAI